MIRDTARPACLAAWFPALVIGASYGQQPNVRELLDCINGMLKEQWQRDQDAQLTITQVPVSPDG